jgi:metal-dependent amidase/aminoacylase/carboxypeptidase family protein
MLSVEECQNLLSTENGLTESEIESIRDTLYSSAELAFEAYWSDSNSGSKNPLRLLQSLGSTDTV